jgi:hypothetical protein
VNVARWTARSAGLLVAILLALLLLPASASAQAEAGADRPPNWAFQMDVDLVLSAQNPEIQG